MVGTVGTEDPTVSVIVPVYNTEAFLCECLDSILAQTFGDLEVLCVDDGSSDNSMTILKEYAVRDPRVRVIPQRTGGRGPGTARNVAIREARGEYLAFVDSDDKVHEDLVQQLLRAARKHDADIAMCEIAKFSAVGEKGRYAGCTYDKAIPGALERRAFSWHDIQKVLFELRFVAWNKIYRKSFVIGSGLAFSEGIFYEDLCFCYPAMLRAERMCFVRKPLYYNRRGREGATTFALGSRVFDALTAMAQFDDFLRSDPGYERLYQRFEAFRLEKLYSYLHKNDTEHLPPFFAALKEIAAMPSLDTNPHLRKSIAKKRRLIVQKDLLEFLTYELWEARTQNAALLRQRRRLLYPFTPVFKVRQLARSALRRVRRRWRRPPPN
jgi:glycosyltransferase involved in cell wall biosynthesis